MHPPPWHHRLDAILNSWLGTPYVRGQCLRGVAVDCAHFVAAVLDELYAIPPDGGLLPTDPGLAREGVAGAIRAMMKRWPHEDVDPHQLEPGDLLFVRAGGLGGGHVLIAGPRKAELWHADSGGFGVCRTGAGAFVPDAIRAFRPKDKHRWNPATTTTAHIA